MSRNTLSFVLELMHRLRDVAGSVAFCAAFAAGLAASSPATALVVPPLPIAIVELAPDLKLQGGGEMRFFGLRVYESWYWSAAPGWSPDEAFALDLVYLRALDGDRIAERSVDEMAKLGLGTAEARARWGAEMKRIFPDVKTGDRVTGVNLPGGKARFYFNGQHIGDIVEPGFARAFFAIWFDPKSSAPDLRKKLLGLK